MNQRQNREAVAAMLRQYVQADTPNLLHNPFKLADIRRRVDKATRHAEATWDRDWTQADAKARAKAFLGAVIHPTPDYAAEVSRIVVKAQFTPIYPASVGKTVATMVYPNTYCRSTEEARAVARVGLYEDPVNLPSLRRLQALHKGDPVAPQYALARPEFPDLAGYQF